MIYNLRIILHTYNSNIMPRIDTIYFRFVMELPKLTPDKNIILITKLLDFEARNFHLHNQIQLAHQIAAFHILRDGYANGVIVFADLKGASYSHILKISVSILKDTLCMLQVNKTLNNAVYLVTYF